MNITIDEGVISYKKHNMIIKYSDSSKKDMVSQTILNTDIVFKDKHGNDKYYNELIYSDINRRK